jgi:hypothetical protein
MLAGFKYRTNDSRHSRTGIRRLAATPGHRRFLRTKRRTL